MYVYYDCNNEYQLKEKTSVALPEGPGFKSHMRPLYEIVHSNLVKSLIISHITNSQVNKLIPTL